MTANSQNTGMMLLRVGAMLQANGASANRIRITIDRIANAYEYNADTLITHRALILSLSKGDQPVFNHTKRIAGPAVNFKIISGISRMSWRIKESPWNIAEIETELNRLASLPHYNRFIILTSVSFADAVFCRLGDGNLPAMGVAFIATFAGLFVRQEAHKAKFNPYLVIFFAAFTATFVAATFRTLFPTAELEMGFAACVLFLIPGVPLINAITDLIDGNILNGIIRATNGLIIALMIAFGMVSSLLIYKL